MCAERTGSARGERLRVVLCWHMHQPEYRDLETGVFHQPWTYLHALKDYADMAAHIEASPNARAVVNFAPVLLEQIDACACAARRLLDERVVPADPLLAALGGVPTTPAARRSLLATCMRANEKRVIGRFEAYAALVRMGRQALTDHASIGWLGEGYFRDLVIWYHLAWMAETARRGDPRLRRLEEHARDYQPSHLQLLLQVVTEMLEGLLPRYRALAESGRVELSFTPWGHPMVPLLLDFATARESMPAVPLPQPALYPAGEDSARWHLREGLRVFRHHLGTQPVGCWLSEGGVSDAALGLLDEFGLAWTASGEAVLANSVARARERGTRQATPMSNRVFAVDGRSVRCFFRSDHLSDLIGFNYSEWHADDAVGHLLHELERIAGSLARPQEHVVSIIMDGENAWEHYPHNGYWLLSTLYERLAAHPRLRLATFDECVTDARANPAGCVELPALVAGSWVYGTFSTWIGEADKNRAWELLVAAREAFLESSESGTLPAARLELARRQLAVCEGSDWFWWFGGYNPAESVKDFDHLYRRHLTVLYRTLGLPPPASLEVAVSTGGSHRQVEHGGVMRRGGQE